MIKINDFLYSDPVTSKLSSSKLLEYENFVREKMIPIISDPRYSEDARIVLIKFYIRLFHYQK